MWEDFIRDYLSFSRKERAGIIILLSLILICIILPFFFHLMIRRPLSDNREFEKQIASLKIIPDSQHVNKYDSNFKKFKSEKYQYASNYKDHKSFSNFYFDPNSATVQEWDRLGVNDKTIGTIQKYLS